MSADGQGRFAILDSMKELPTLPQVLVNISRVAGDPKSSTNALAEIILHDQSLTLRLLRIANSAQYAIYAQRITTVSKAVVLLGFQSVRAIAIGAETFRALSQLTKAGEVLERFWKDSVAVAVVSQEIGNLVGLQTVEEAFVAGLIHDVGKLVLAQYDPDGARILYSRNISEREILLEETRIYGINHTEIGAELARRWQLPQEIRMAMELHHRHFSRPPASGGEQLAFIVAASRAILDPRYREESMRRELASSISRILLKPVGLIGEMLKEIPCKIQEYADFFDLRMDDLKEYTLWVEEENQRLSQGMSERESGRRILERRDAMMAAIRNLHALLLDSQGPGKVASTICRVVHATIGARRVVLMTLDPARRTVGELWTAGVTSPEFERAIQHLPFDNGLMAQVARERIVANVLDARTPYFSHQLSASEREVFEYPCLALFPIAPGDHLRALLYADREADAEPFDDAELADIKTLADIMALALRS